ncbi:MAG: hypothetical protein ACSLE3_14050, partial [Microbacteriaceae bacterium]
DTIQEAARVERRQLHDAADETAQRIVSDAEKRARQLVREAKEQAAAAIAEAEDRLAEIRLERDAIAEYFQNLRGILGTAEEVQSKAQS